MSTEPRPQTTNADPTIRALQFAIQTTLNAKKLEQENETLKQKLAENEKLLSEFDDARIRAKSLKTQLKEKEQKLEKKREELIQIQNAIIDTLQSPAVQQPDPTEALAPIPIVMNRIQELIMSLTEQAADEKTTQIPVTSIFKTSEKLNQLYDALVEQDIIHETPEERDERIRKYTSAQQEIITHLQEIVTAAHEEYDEEEQQPEEEEAAAPEEKEAEPKVVEVTEEEEQKKEEPAKEEPAPTQEQPAPAQEEPKPADAEAKEEQPAPGN